MQHRNLKRKGTWAWRNWSISSCCCLICEVKPSDNRDRKKEEWHPCCCCWWWCSCCLCCWSPKDNPSPVETTFWLWSWVSSMSCGDCDCKENEFTRLGPMALAPVPSLPLFRELLSVSSIIQIGYPNRLKRSCTHLGHRKYLRCWTT